MLPVLVLVFFVAPSFVFEQPTDAGHLGVLRFRVNASRFGAGVGGLGELSPCVPDSEVEHVVPLYAAVNPLHMDENGFEPLQLSQRVTSHLAEHRYVFPSTLGNVLDTSKHAAYARLKQLLRGSVFHLSIGMAVVVEVEGFIVRKVAPMGQAADKTFAAAASGMHIDQNAAGRPLTQIHVPHVPWLSVSNLLLYAPFVRLVNVWTALSERVMFRPLVLLDMQTVNTDTDLVAHSHANDIVLLRYSPEHALSYKPVMRRGEAWVFDTTRSPHASASLPGEECLLALRNAMLDGACAAACTMPQTAPPEVRAVQSEAMQLCRAGNSTAALELLTRESLEFRALLLVVPDWFYLSVTALLAAIVVLRAQ